MYIFGLDYKKSPMDAPALQRIHGAGRVPYAFFMNAS